MSNWNLWALLSLCAAAAVWPRLPARFARLWVGPLRLALAASLFVFLVSRGQGGALTGDFFAPGLWGRGALVLAVLWVAGLALAYGELSRAGVPLAPLTLLALGGLCVLAGAQGNLRVVAALAPIAVLVAALWRIARHASLTPEVAQLTGFLVAGAALLAESGPSPHLAFSAWWVALFVPLFEAALVAVAVTWRWLGGEAAPNGGTLYSRLVVGRNPFSPDLAERSEARPRKRVSGSRLYWGISIVVAVLTVTHYATGVPSVHGVMALLALAAFGLEWAARRDPTSARRWRVGEWAVIVLLLLACLTRAPNLFHQGFLTWDESRYAVIARDFLVTHDLGWTGARPLYILLLGWAYAIWGATDSIGGGVSLLAGVLSIALTYAWARRAVGRRAAVASAALLAASVLHGWFSRYQNSMALVTVFLALAGWAYARALRHPRPERALLASGAALGLAWMSHYAVGLAVPFWLLFAPFGGPNPSWRGRAQRLVAFSVGLAVVVGLWVALMPAGAGPISNLLHHSGVPLGCCLLDDFRNHLLPGATATTVPGALLQPAELVSGDVGYYARALLVFEGWVGLALIAAALVWPVVRWIRRRELPVLHLWVITAGPLAILSITAALGLDARARTLVDILPSLAILAGLTVSDAAQGLSARFGSAAGRNALAAGLAAALLVSVVRAAPLRAMTTPYAGVTRWLAEQGARTLVVFNPYGDDNGFAWQFYFGPAALFAYTEADVLRACAEGSPEYMISAGEPLRELAGLPVVARFDNPIYSTIPRLYDQQPHSRFVGPGLLGPPNPPVLMVYDLRGCGA